MAAIQQPQFATPLFVKPRESKHSKRSLSKDEQDEIRYAFETLDYERSGFVSQKQLKVALRAMGFGVKKNDVYELLRRQGEEETQRLDFSTFQRVVADKLAERTVAEDLKRAFQLFDVHGMGKIDAPALRKIVKSLGLELGEQELQDMIDEFDHDNDGMISEAEFMAIMAAGDDE